MCFLYTIFFFFGVVNFFVAVKIYYDEAPYFINFLEKPYLW